MTFNNEADFEKALILDFCQHGWNAEIIEYPTEKDLLKNWADILFKNNRGPDRLGDYELTDGEMQQILEQIEQLRTPVKLNGFINGKTVAIKRDNPADKAHLGKEVSLKIYDRKEIAGGTSRYQIARQPRFPSGSIRHDRRGDLMLLINGMPVIHIELKKSGIPVSKACNQIEKYSHEGVFTGFFGLVQIFVAMTPEETRYFANPGIDGVFNPDYYFHWADVNNEPINDWKTIALDLLSIPMAHQLIGFYTIADTSDGVLKVMRSYQYYAASAISDAVMKHRWGEGNQRGGFVWHTTGSGKTMTSFKSAQLIANSGKAEKVVFLTDRIELGTQSLKEYRSFADESESVQATENTHVLLSKLKSKDVADTLIVTSIQKMSNLQTEEGFNEHDIDVVRKKKIVFIVDEAHRSTFGDMLGDIKKTYPDSLFFGFTGTPVFAENAKKESAQTDVFGRELHRYSIADGIRDKNVLGFDPYKVCTFQDRKLRECVALEKAKAKSIEEALADEHKRKIYYRYMDNVEVPMVGCEGEDGKWVKGIEDYVPPSQYSTEEHHRTVLKDIQDNWVTLSHNGKFHALFATSSIAEAIEYYHLFKEHWAELKVTCLFDPNIDNDDGCIDKEDALVEILEDYNKRYKQEFTMGTHHLFKKDVAMRLAHKEQHKWVQSTPEKELDLLIVVDQMLTGFDSNWVNTLYIDKMMEYENVIQAFSRTNRLFGPEKPFGTIRYYRRPHTMEKNIEKAVALYSGNRPIGLFVDKLPDNLQQLNEKFASIKDLFEKAEVPDFDRLPEEIPVRAKFASLFNEFNKKLEAAKVQGFVWDKLDYPAEGGSIHVLCDATTYSTLLQRYKELTDKTRPVKDPPDDEDAPYDIRGYLTEIDTGRIDSDYLNSRFDKYLRTLHREGVTPEMIEEAKKELHQSFAVLSQEQQNYANVFLHDLETGEAMLEPGKTLSDYITDYQCRAKADQLSKLVQALGVDLPRLEEMLTLNLTEENINEFGRFDALRSSADFAKAKAFFEKKEGQTLPPPRVYMMMDKLLRRFILAGGFDIE